MFTLLLFFLCFLLPIQAVLSPITGFADKANDNDDFHYVNGYVIASYLNGSSPDTLSIVTSSFSSNLSTKYKDFPEGDGFIIDISHSPDNSLAVIQFDSFFVCNGTDLFPIPDTIFNTEIDPFHWISNTVAFARDYDFRYIIDFSDFNNITKQLVVSPADLNCADDMNSAIFWNDSLIINCENSTSFSEVLAKFNTDGSIDPLPTTGDFNSYSLEDAGKFLISIDDFGFAVRIESGDTDFKPIYNTAFGNNTILGDVFPCASNFSVGYDEIFGWGSISHSTGNFTSFGFEKKEFHWNPDPRNPVMQGINSCILPAFVPGQFETRFPFSSMKFIEFPSGATVGSNLVGEYSFYDFDRVYSVYLGSYLSFAIWPTTTDGLEGVAFDGTSTTVIDVISGYASSSPQHCHQISPMEVMCTGSPSVDTTGIIYFNVSSNTFTAYNFTFGANVGDISVNNIVYSGSNLPLAFGDMDFEDGLGSSSVAIYINSVITKVTPAQTSYLRSEDFGDNPQTIIVPDGVISFYPFKNSGLELAFINNTAAYLLYESGPGLFTENFHWTGFDNHALVIALPVSSYDYNITFVDSLGVESTPFRVTAFARDKSGNCDFVVYTTDTSIFTLHKNGSSYSQSTNFTSVSLDVLNGFCKDGYFYVYGTLNSTSGMLQIAPDASFTINSNVNSEFLYFDEIRLVDGKYYFFYSKGFYQYVPPKYLVDPAVDTPTTVEFYPDSTPTFGFDVCGTTNPAYLWFDVSGELYGRYQNDPQGSYRVLDASSQPICGPDGSFYVSKEVSPTSLENRMTRDFGVVSNPPNSFISENFGCINSNCDGLFIAVMNSTVSEFSYSNYSGYSVSAPETTSDNDNPSEETNSSPTIFYSLVCLIVLLIQF